MYGYPPPLYQYPQAAGYIPTQPYYHKQVINLPPHNPSSSYRFNRPRAINYGSYEERKSNPPPQSDAKLPLTLDNYRRKFKALLYYEEEEHVSLLAKK